MKKKTLNPSAQDLKIQWEIRFSTFLCWSKRSKKIYNRNLGLLISKLLSKSILGLGKWSNWKYANTYLRIFTVWPLPEVQNWFWKQFWNEKVDISVVIFFWVFWPTKKVVNWISHCIFKSCAEGFRVFFLHARAQIFSPNALYLHTK